MGAFENAPQVPQMCTRVEDHCPEWVTQEGREGVSGEPQTQSRKQGRGSGRQRAASQDTPAGRELLGTRRAQGTGHLQILFLIALVSPALGLCPQAAHRASQGPTHPAPCRYGQRSCELPLAAPWGLEPRSQVHALRWGWGNGNGASLPSVPACPVEQTHGSWGRSCFAAVAQSSGLEVSFSVALK